MVEIDQEYELKILKTFISQYLEKSIPMAEDGLEKLQLQRDNTVWDIATQIYSQSGRKVEFCFVRDMVDSHIKAMRHQLIIEKERIAEQTRLVAERTTMVMPKVIEIVIDQLGVDQSRVTLDSHLFRDLGVEVLDSVELCMALEEGFDIEITDQMWEGISTIGEIVNVIKKKVST
jgi:acyl carrier protein